MQDRRLLIQKRARLLRTRRMAVGGGGGGGASATITMGAFGGSYTGFNAAEGNGVLGGHGDVGSISDNVVFGGFTLTGLSWATNSRLYIIFGETGVTAETGWSLTVGENTFARADLSVFTTFSGSAYGYIAGMAVNPFTSGETYDFSWSAGA